ncbi:MAG: hypothetical protein JXR61_13030 [Prolixibacteraceae bacterium]|nr:hypothetical protein [Prolixibacteraceae bacterium]
MVKKIYVIGLFVFALLFSNAQEAQLQPVQNSFKGTRFVNAQSVNLSSEGELILFIQHRFGDISYGISEFFGLDEATMRIGFEYGLSRNLNIGIGRSTMFKTYDANLKFRLFQQTKNFPVTVAATAEGSIPTIKDFFPEAYDNFSNKYSADFQLHISKTIGIFGFQLSPGYLHTGYLFPDNDKFDLVTLGFGGSAKISKMVTVNMEYLHHFEQHISASKPLSLGADLSTGGHLFQLILTNAQGMNNSLLYTNTFGDWPNGNIYFGFNLIRTFKLKYTDADFY